MMEEKKIKCLCGQIFKEIKLKKHITNCIPFLNVFKKFDFKIARILEEYSSKNENIYLVKYLLKRYVKLIDHKIKKKEENNYIYNINLINEEEKFQDENNIGNNFLNNINLKESYFPGKNNIISNTLKESFSKEKDLIINKGNKDFSGKSINIINEEIKTPSDDNKNYKSKEILSFLSPHKHKKCKFCNDNLNKNGICENQKCKELNSISCQKKLKCGHYCLGVRDEIFCPPCLDKNCKYYGGIFNQNRDTCCQICLQKLSDLPIVNLSCDHYIHYFCIIKKLNEGKNHFGKKLNFDCIKCPVCDTIFECPSIPSIQKKIEIQLILYLTARNMIQQRLLYKNINSNKDLFDIFIFYICYRCHNPYYAGLNKDYNNNINQKDENEFFGNIEDCLCGKDSFLPDAKGENFCQKHGNNYIEYKCKFCCNIASRFFSKTHFCEECYKNKNIMNDQLCPIKICNQDSCEFRGKHEPNGTEYCLGCFICRHKNIPKLND